MNSANFVSDSAGLSTKLMNHSTSVNTLLSMGTTPSLINAENYRAGPKPSLYNRFSPHESRPNAAQHQAHHSQSTANLTAPAKLSFRGHAVTSSSNNRQSATSGVKLVPSSQLGSWANNNTVAESAAQAAQN